jgi:hypothetical protein
MLRCASDVTTATLVARVWAETLDEDFQVFRNSLHEVDQAALRIGRVPATIMEVLDGAQRPNAEQRRILAETWDQLSASKQIFALVTTSAMARGVFKVVHWLNPPGTTRLETVHSTFAQAVNWVEAQRAEALPRFNSLREQAASASRRVPRRG